MSSGLDRKPGDHGSPGQEQEADHVSHAAAVATISMDPTAAEATDDGTGDEQRHQTQGVDGPSSSSENNKYVAEPQQSGQNGSVHPADRVRGGDAALMMKVKKPCRAFIRRPPLLTLPPCCVDAFACLSPQDQEADNSRNASGELGSSSGSNSLDDGNCSNTAEGEREPQDGNSGNKQADGSKQQETQQQELPAPMSMGSGSEVWLKQGGGGQGEENDLGVKVGEVQEDEDQMQGGRPVLKKPDKLEPCPRCDSYDTKFCYYNNYNIKQPRHFCKNCQRYWTAGGTLRNVPVGAGRRKNKHKSMHRLGPSSGSESELIIPSSSGGEEYLIRSGSIRSNPSLAAPVFKSPPSQVYQGRFPTPSTQPNYDSPANEKSVITNKREVNSEPETGTQFGGNVRYGFRGDEFAHQSAPEEDPRRAKRLKRSVPVDGEGLGVPVTRYVRGPVQETSECMSTSPIMNQDGASFANEVLMSSMQPAAVPVQARANDAFGSPVNWNQASTGNHSAAWGSSTQAPWGNMWNQPWPYTMPMGNWNGNGGQQVLAPPGTAYAGAPQGNNWGMVDNTAAFGNGTNWGSPQVNAANVAGAAAAWANANVWAGLAAAGNAWGPPWAAWSMFGAGPAAAALAPSQQTLNTQTLNAQTPAMKQQRGDGVATEGGRDGVWVPKIVRTEPVRGSAPLQWQQQLGQGLDTGYLGMLKMGDLVDAAGQEEGSSAPLNLLH